MAIQSLATDDALLDEGDIPRTANVIVKSKPDANLPKVVAHIGQQIGQLSINVADMSGTVGDVSQEIAKQTHSIQQVTANVDQIAEQNNLVAELTADANAVATQVSDELENTVSSVEATFAKSADDIQVMANSSQSTVSEFGGVKEKLDQVYDFSQSITRISSETQFLAINAGILAANTGEAGNGFKVIAESIRELAQETSSVSKNIVSQLDELKQTVDRLVDETTKSNQTAVEAVGRTDEIETQISKFRQFSADVGSMAKKIVDIAQPVARNSEICFSVAENARALSRESEVNASALNRTSKKFDQLVSFSEEMIVLVAESGVETPDTPIINICQEAAREIEHCFLEALDNGEITMDALFDENYQQIAGSDPVQVMTKFTTFTDRVLPPIQEPAKESHERIAFVAAVDRNGYLPTHNDIYSQPQSSDPVWNAANCRNRRIFNDRTGAAAGANRKLFLLQTYRRDMGGGEFILMKDLSVPIMINGRHWGGLRMGIKV